MTFRRRTASGNTKRWKCGGKIDHATACISQYLPERVLYEKTAQVIGIEDFTDEDFKKSIDCIVVSRPNTLSFKMKDGGEVVKTWEGRSRWQ